MKLKKLFENVTGICEPEEGFPEKEIGDICYNSCKAKRNSVFVCLRGSLSDGHRYAAEAYEKGCRFFVAEMPLPELPDDAQVFLCPDSRLALAEMSANLFRHPSDELTVIGITGTKGKTTTALLICHILNAAGLPCGYIGSNGIEYGNFHCDTPNTTPESYTLQMYMRHMVLGGVKYLVMEVSSQALYRHRVKGIRFDTCVFTNLSVDHIGKHEHPDFEHYKACKKSLFSDYGAKEVILNADDGYVSEFREQIPAGTRIREFAIEREAVFRASEISLYRRNDSLGVNFSFVSDDGKKRAASIPFPGNFSVYNALAAIAVCRRFGIDADEIVRQLADIRIAGRFEIVKALPYATFLIDYAHNKVSLAAALNTLRLYQPEHLICLFGSVGGRTFGRRAELGEVAARLADFVILTSDNPDGEDPQKILDEIAEQFTETSCPYRIIPDRAEAIRYAVAIAGEGDIILLAGKGHENYQLVCGQKLPFSEKKILQRESAKRLALR